MSGQQGGCRTLRRRPVLTMYLQITTRCQMACRHCCWDCSASGEDMPYKTFQAAVRLAAETGCAITIGGGEPTLHPGFWDMADFASRELPEGFVGVVTNGYDREQAFRVLEWHLAGRLEARLSRDRFHSPISPEVVKAFAAHDLVGGLDEHVVRAGRALKNGIGDLAYPDGVPICICDEPFMPPSGELYSCGCRKVSFGRDPATWSAAYSGFLESEPYSCASVSEWKRERIRRLLRRSVGA